MNARTIAPALLAALAVAAAVGCSSTGVQSSGASTPPPNGTSTPAPTGTANGTPTPAPTPATICSFIWETASANGATVDLYEVDVDSSVWMSGSTPIDGDFVAAYYVLGLDQNDGFTSAGLAIDGSFDLTAGGMQLGDAASMNAASSLTFYDATALFKGTSQDLGGQSATGGTGSWTGNLSDLNSQTPSFGSGSVTVDIGGTNTTFGGSASSTNADVAGCETLTN